MTMFESSQPNASMQTELPLMSSAGASPARTSASLEQARALPASDRGYGASSRDSLASYDHDMQLWRTSEPWLFADWPQSLETLPPSGSMRNGKLYLRRAWGRHMPESGAGLLPTPAARDWRDLTNSGVAYAASRARHQPSLATRAYLAGFSGRQLIGIYEWAMGMPARWTRLER